MRTGEDSEGWAGVGMGRRGPSLDEIKASLKVIFARYQDIHAFQERNMPVVTYGDGKSLTDESIKLSPCEPQLS